MAAAEGSEPRCPEDSSDSEPEQEPGSPQKLIRKVSTSGQIRSKTVLKEGFLQKQSSSFQRCKRRYFKLRGRTLYYAQTPKVYTNIYTVYTHTHIHIYSCEEGPCTTPRPLR
ncbi:diacylglycerol kinase delta-like [Notothenia coriiceps]|uniref:Diacylglycerol kinase delta-like n=1 Tax=Notothenia coriiceps TaxID=8208 RepID=A0A6I9Q2V3_9TELE|nr:PREDICTED: diacylglycerol kinase delta-like [Notothenia coriiceps]